MAETPCTNRTQPPHSVPPPDHVGGRNHPLPRGERVHPPRHFDSTTIFENSVALAFTRSPVIRSFAAGQRRPAILIQRCPAGGTTIPARRQAAWCRASKDEDRGPKALVLRGSRTGVGLWARSTKGPCPHRQQPPARSHPRVGARGQALSMRPFCTVRVGLARGRVNLMAQGVGIAHAPAPRT
jgi:hypothetical protein